MDIDLTALLTQITGANAKVIQLGLAVLGVIVTVFTIKVLRRGV